MKHEIMRAGKTHRNRERWSAREIIRRERERKTSRVNEKRGNRKKKHGRERIGEIVQES